jgi:hypothetical protein
LSGFGEYTVTQRAFCQIRLNARIVTKHGG